MSRCLSRVLAIVLAVMASWAPLRAEDSRIPGLDGKGRRWVALLIDDHGGQREIIWDPRFQDLNSAGPFLKDHRYALVTSASPGLVDLGCCDETWPRTLRAGAPVASGTWTSDRSGVVISAGAAGTWIPVIEPYDGRGVPAATFRGAYLNWLLQNRPGASPGIPRETRWQRIQRGALAIAQQLLYRGKDGTGDSDAPEYRLVGIGASGRLLIPPGEGLPAALDAINRMQPYGDGGSMDAALVRGLGSLKDEDQGDPSKTGRCSPNIIFAVSDGQVGWGRCGSMKPFESSGDYPDMVLNAGRIAATGRAMVWTWSLTGSTVWSRTLASQGLGSAFDGDAVASIATAVTSWKAMSSAPQIGLTIDHPVLTRFSAAILTVTVDRPVASATLNGKTILLNGTSAQIPVTLAEGLNTFSVTATDACGGRGQASLSVVLDTVPPHITLDQAPPALTNQLSVALAGHVDDPAAHLTLNGVPVPLDAQGAFSLSGALALEGRNVFSFAATDPAGNQGMLAVQVVRDTIPPVITLASPPEGLITNAATIQVAGQVDDFTAQILVNGVLAPPDAAGRFNQSLTPPEGPLTVTVVSKDPAGNASTVSRHLTIDRTPPVITLIPPPPALTNQTSLQLSGRVDGGATSLLLNGAPVAMDAQGGFSLTLALPLEGPNAFTLQALDTAGNVGTLSTSITRDTIPPVVALTAPPDGLLTNAATLIVLGQVDDPASTLAVNGQSVPLDSTGHFSLALSPAEGPLTLTAAATDLAGNAGSASRSIVIDRTAPKITLAQFPPLLTNQRSVHVAGGVDDPSATFTLNGAPLALDAQGRFALDLSLPVEGVNAFHFAATDAAGNAGTLDTAVMRDTVPPVITVSSPAEGLDTNQATVTLQGQVDDPTAALTVNGVPVVLDASGAFSARTSLTAEGANLLTLRAVDPAGNEGTALLHITRDTLAPKVALESPADGLITNAASITVIGSVDDATAAVQLNGQAVTVDASGRFSLVLTPSEGPLTLTAAATDPAGNRSSAMRSIVIDRTPPRIVLNQNPPVLTRNTSLPLAGSVDDPKASLTLGGVQVPLDASGGFSTTAALVVEGVNTLTFTATDLAGNIGTLTLSVTRDTTPPRITLTSPQEGSATNQHSVAVTGTVDDASAPLTINGQSVSVGADGSFTTSLSASKEGAFAVDAQATDAAGNTGRTVHYVTFDWTPPVLAWADPTPAAGTQITTNQITPTVLVSEGALTSLNGQRAELMPSGLDAMPFKAQTDLTVQEGQVALLATAVDGAGNRASITRSFDVGLTTPVITVSSPAFGASGAFTTANIGVTLSGTVTAPAFVRPLTLAVNGQAVPLASDGTFTLPLALVVGANPVALVASNRFGQTATRNLVVTRTPGVPPPGTAPGITLDWPQPGFASAAVQVTVQGHVLVPGMTATLNGAAVAVDPQSLAFSSLLTLQPGTNTLTAVGTDAQGRTASASVTGTYVPADAASYLWQVPAAGAHVTSKSVAVAGTAVQPGIVSLSVNGTAMALDPAHGTFSGTVVLQAPGPNGLLLIATTLSGSTLQERRQISFEAPLPQMVLSAPTAARPGDPIPIQVSPAAGTNLVKADLTFNGRFLATVQSPWTAVTAQVPSDAVVGSQIPVEAVGTDDQGATVTSRTTLTVYGQGALLVSAYDDSQGLPMTDGKGAATLESGASQALDTQGRAALPTALPQDWLQVSHPGFVPVWRAAGLTVGGVQRAVDARLTPLALGQSADVSGFSGDFGGGTLHMDLPSNALSAPAQVSVTALSTQGLPGLLPAGWSALSAWWLDVGNATLASPGTATLNLAPSLAQGATLPAGANLAWIHWDATQNVWMVLADGLTPSNLTGLSLPTAGGYALVVPDASPTAPPAAVSGSPLAGYAGQGWEDGLTAAGSITPSILPTVAAIDGARATAQFNLSFGTQPPLPSGALIQTDVLQLYTLVDQSVIEPDVFTEDAVATPWLLEAVNGKPALSAVTGGLALRLPVRMSRTFDPTQLVQGRILVGFYHDGTEVASSGSGLIGASGGSVSQDGVTVGLPAGAVSGTTLVRVSGNAGDPWTELPAGGRVLSSFNVDVVGTLLSGMSISLDGLPVPTGVRPLLVERQIVQGQRVAAAVGELAPGASKWSLTMPAGGNPVLSGGSFAVWIAPAPWDWVSGTTVIPAEVATALLKSLGARAKLTMPKRSLARASATTADPSAVADVVVGGGSVQAVSGPTGAFAVPALLPATAGATAALQGSRWDLGLTGSVSAAVPSQGNTLSLSVKPFTVQTVLPDPGAPIPPTAIFTLLTSAPMDPATLPGVTLSKDVSGSLTPLAIQPSLSQDGRTLMVTPTKPLEADATFHLAVNGLAGLSGGTAPALDLVYTTTTAPAALVDFSRIQLGYPDASFNVTVTVPEGAIPPGAELEIQAPQMGSVATATMLPKGDMTFLLKANLGERLSIRVQLPDGRVFTGYLSRYAATDGSGRVTVGVDGGRVVSADGKAAATFPEGAFDTPTEVQVEFTQEVPSELDPTLAAQEKIAGRIRLLSSQEDVELKKRPILELLAPANPDTSPHTDGLGSYAVYDRVEGVEDDGSPAVYFELSDTASLAGTMLKSQGGLPAAISLTPTGGAATGLAGPVSIKRAMGPGRKVHHANAPRTLPVKAAEKSPRAPIAAQDFGGVDGLAGAFLDSFLIDAGPYYIGGFADISIAGAPVKPAIGAFVFFHKGSDSTIQRAGQMLQRTSAPAGSYILASFLTGELVRGGGEVMGIDADFGTRAFSGSSWGGPGGLYGTYFHAPTLHFEVNAEDQADRVAPYVNLMLNRTGPKGEVINDWVELGTNVYLRAQASDNRPGSLAVHAQTGNQAIPLSKAKSSNLFFGSFQARAAGLTRVQVSAMDVAGNRTTVSRDVHVLNFAGGQDVPGPLSLSLDPAEPAPGDWLKVTLSQSTVVPISGVQVTCRGVEVPIYVLSVTDVSQPVRAFYIEPKSGWIRGQQHILNLALDPQNPQIKVTATFMVQDVTVLGSAVLSGRPIGPIAALGDRAFVAVQTPEGSKIQVFQRVEASGQDPALISTGAFAPAKGNGFYGQTIDCMKAFRRVPMGKGGRRDLLLVTTSADSSDHQAVLWAFDLCGSPDLAEVGTPGTVPSQVAPIFAVSLGPGAAGYSPSLDQMNGLITVGRLGSSVLIIGADKAYEGWGIPVSGDPTLVTEPAGANLGAILQPFYLGNPEGRISPAHWGVGLLGAFPSATSDVPVVVSSGYVGLSRAGMPLDGLPISFHRWSTGREVRPPYQGTDSNDPNSPDFRAWPAPIYPLGATSGVDYRVSRVAAWPDAQVTDPDGTNPRTTNLATGVSAMPSPSGKGNSLVVMEYPKAPNLADPKSGNLVGQWPGAGDAVLGANGPSYQLIGSTHFLSLDRLAGVCTVGVNVGGQIKALVLDLRKPAAPSVLADLGEAGEATVSNGIAYQTQSVSSTDGAGVPGISYMLLAKRVMPGANEGNLGPCGAPSDTPHNECDGSADPDLRILSVVPDDSVAENATGSAIKSQGRKYLSSTPPYDPFKAVVISMPRAHEQNTLSSEAPHYLVTFRRPSNYDFRGLCLSLSGGGSDTQLMQDQGVGGAATDPLTLVSSQADPSDPHFTLDKFKVDMTIRPGVDLSLESAPPPGGVTYRFIMKAAPSGSDKVVQSAPYDLSSRDKADIPLWPLYRSPDGMARYSIRDAGGDDWCTPWVYRFLADPTNRAALVAFNDISGEHGTDLGHSGHRLGTDVDFQNPSPETLPDSPTGGGNYEALLTYISKAEGTGPTAASATNALRTWVLAARARLELFLKVDQVAQVFYCDPDIANSRDIDKLLRTGILVGGDGHILIDLELPTPVWVNPTLNKLTMQSGHSDHFHITFNPDSAGP